MVNVSMVVAIAKKDGKALFANTALAKSGMFFIMKLFKSFKVLGQFWHFSILQFLLFHFYVNLNIICY